MAEPDRTEAARTHGNTGHGHVWPRPDGMRARCGGPGLCAECSRDKALRDKQGEMPVTPAPEPTNDAVSDERLREIERPWLLVKRGFYWRPEGMGYTAFKAEAGRYTDADAAMIVDEPGEGTSRIRYDDAEEFSPACPDDAKVRMLMVERSRLRTELLTRRSVTSQASEGAGWKLVPIRITPEMAHALESNIAECTDPSEIHQENWANAWHQAVLLAPEYSAPVSKRVERLEAALNAVLNAPRGTSGRIILDGYREEAARQALQGGRS